MESNIIETKRLLDELQNYGTEGMDLYFKYEPMFSGFINHFHDQKARIDRIYNRDKGKEDWDAEDDYESNMILAEMSLSEELQKLQSMIREKLRLLKAKKTRGISKIPSRMVGYTDRKKKSAKIKSTRKTCSCKTRK